RRRIALRKIEAADDHPVNRRFDVAALAVLGIARQAPPGFDRLPPAPKDGDAVPAFLSVPDDAIAGLLDHVAGEFLVWRLELLQADDVGLSHLEPAQENREPPIDAIDVEGRDLHGRT